MQQRRVPRMGGRGMYDQLKAIEKQRKNLLGQQEKIVKGREEEIKQEQEQARKAERKRLMEAELAVLDAQKKSLEDQRRANQGIIQDATAGLKKRQKAAADFEAYDAATARARLDREKQLAELQRAVDDEKLSKAKEAWERRVKEMELALQIAEKEAEREALGDKAAQRRAQLALDAANAKKRELDWTWQIEEANNRIANHAAPRAPARAGGGPPPRGPGARRPAPSAGAPVGAAGSAEEPVGRGRPGDPGGRRRAEGSEPRQEGEPEPRQGRIRHDRAGGVQEEAR